MGKQVKYKIRKVNDAGIDVRLENVVAELRTAVVDEYDAIRKYTFLYEMIQNASKEMGVDYTDILNCIEDIINEEKKHVGEFNELIKTVTPKEYELYEAGKKEVIKIIKVGK